jgi:uncharacterized BrkB/YihY/UPF0761 family membrane protein
MIGRDRSSGASWAAAIAGAIWSASSYVAAFMRASNAIYDIEEGRPVWMTLPVRVGVTLVLWDIAKWPVLLLVVGFMFSILYWAAPNVKHPGFRWVSPGGVFAVAVWVIASAAFALYVANFSAYNKSYGKLAGVIIFLVWLWISNIAVLLGAEWNAEIERGRQIEAGHPADHEPFVEPRKGAQESRHLGTPRIPPPAPLGPRLSRVRDSRRRVIVAASGIGSCNSGRESRRLDAYHARSASPHAQRLRLWA